MAGGGRFGVSVCVCTPARSCPTLCDPMDCSLPGFSVCGILQARILEWTAISFSKASGCLLGLLHWQTDSLPLSHLEAPLESKDLAKLTASSLS